MAHGEWLVLGGLGLAAFLLMRKKSDASDSGSGLPSGGGGGGGSGLPGTSNQGGQSPTATSPSTNPDGSSGAPGAAPPAPMPPPPSPVQTKPDNSWMKAVTPGFDHRTREEIVADIQRQTGPEKGWTPPPPPATAKQPTPWANTPTGWVPVGNTGFSVPSNNDGFSYSTEAEARRGSPTTYHQLRGGTYRGSGF